MVDLVVFEVKRLNLFLALEKGNVSQVTVIKIEFLWVLNSLTRTAIHDQDIWDLRELNIERIGAILDKMNF